MTPAPEQVEQMLNMIRSGIYPHVAAQAAGIPRAVFERWMERGRRTRQGECHDIHAQVEQARAQARSLAEHEVRHHDIRFWLRHGPGKDDGPGWGQADAEESARRHSLLAQREFGRLVWRLLRILEPFPDARRAIRDAFRRGRSAETSLPGSAR